MIYEYLKNKLNADNPEEYLEALRKCEDEIRQLRNEFGNTWTYCCGCKDYAKVDEAYDGWTDNGRPVMRCGKCGSIWRFLD